MSSTTFVLSNYSFESSVRRALTKETKSDGSTRFFGPSPFEIPESVQVTLSLPNQLTFQFNYPVEEHTEPEERKASANGKIMVKLAEKTKKIVQIRFQDNLENLLRDRFSSLGPLVIPFPESLSNQAQNSLRLNVSLIEKILQSMPDELVGDLTEALRQDVSRNVRRE